MNIPKKKNIDVTVVGAGPTGLLLAGDLAEAGLAVALVEKRGPEVSNISRAFGVHARTLELLDARGLTEDLQASQPRHRAPCRQASPSPMSLLCRARHALGVSPVSRLKAALKVDLEVKPQA